jgi:hypothetical protein
MSQDLVAQQARRIVELEAKLSSAEDSAPVFGQPAETEVSHGSNASLSQDIDASVLACVDSANLLICRMRVAQWARLGQQKQLLRFCKAWGADQRQLPIC